MARKESARMRELREAREAREAELEAQGAGAQFIDDFPEIARLRESLGDGQFTVRIQRKGDDGLFEKFPTMPLESFDPDSIASKYGGGVYKFDVLDADGTYVKRFTASYSKLIKPKPDTPEGQKSSSVLASPEFALIQQMMQANAAAIAAANQQTMTMMSEMVKAMAVKPQGNDIKDLILALKGLKDISGSDSTNELVKGALSMAGKFMEMGRDSASATDPESNILNKLIEFLPGVLTKLGQVAAPAATPTGPALPAPATVIPTPPAPTPPEPAKSEAYKKYPNVSLMMRQLGARLVEIAKSNADPKITAAQLAEEIPEAYEPEVDSFIQDARAIDYMIEIFPPLSLHTDWLKRFIAALDAEFQEEPEVVKDAEPAGV